MTYLIRKDFTDKYTGDHYEAGAVVEFSDERAAEILSTCEVILPLDDLIAAHASTAETNQKVDPAAETDQAKPAARRTRTKKEAGAK